MISTIFVFFLDSFSWYFLELGSILKIDFYWETITNNSRFYPGQFFKNTPIYYIMAFIPLYFIGILLVPLIQNKPIDDLTFQFLILFISVIISIFGLLINWQYGLKKYEAFG